MPLFRLVDGGPCSTSPPGTSLDNDKTHQAESEVQCCSHAELCRQPATAVYSRRLRNHNDQDVIKFIPSSSGHATTPVKEPGCLVRLHLETQSRPCCSFRAQDTIAAVTNQQLASAALAARRGSITCSRRHAQVSTYPGYPAQAKWELLCNRHMPPGCVTPNTITPAL